MRLTVRHATHYTYEDAPTYLVQRLHLLPADFATQKTLHWTIEAPGMENALKYRDGMGNWVHLVTCVPGAGGLDIIAQGEVETQDSAGVVRGLVSAAPEAIFRRTTLATEASPALQKFASGFDKRKPVLERAHAIMDRVHETVAYEVGASEMGTSAAQAFEAGKGVCQDHAHIMIALACHLGLPARYVTGYLVTGIGASASAAHAWAEIFVPDLGWVGFDAANGQCPTEHYVRVAAGLDAGAVAPVRGSRRGGPGAEQLRVEVRVEISQQ